MSCPCKKAVNIFESSSTPYRIGKTGENVYQEIEFNFSKWLSEYPDAKIDLLIRAPKNGFYLLAEGIAEPTYLWRPSAFDLANPGRAAVMARMSSGEVRAKSDPVPFEIVRSMDYNLDISEPGPTRPSLMDEWIEDIYDAAARYPKIGEDGYWYVWDVVEGDWIKTETSASVEIPQEQIESAINDYFNEHPIRDSNAVHYDESESLTSEEKEQARDNIGAGTYSKPSGGIPATDLEPNVIPSVPQMATQTDMSDWTSGKTVDAEVLKTDFQLALESLYAVADDVDAQSDEIDDLKSGKADKSELPDLTGYATETWVENKGYQTAPFEIEIAESDSTFSTTATAQEILDNADNCVAVLRDGAEVIKPDLITRNGSTVVSILFTAGVVAGGLSVTQIVVTAANGNVTVQGSSTRFTPLPDTASASIGDFLRLNSDKNAVWQTVQTYQGGSY